MKLPIYELRINEEDDSFVEAIALVDSPAIESNFLAFSQEQKNLTFSMDDEKMELIGAAMIPDMKIFRYEPGSDGYHVYFTKDTVRQIAQVFMKKGLQNSLNLDHTDKEAKSFVYQSYIVDSEKGMTSPKGLNLQDGSWVVGVKINDKQVWEDVKSGKRKGFSVEGLFQMFKTEFKSASAKVNKDEEEVIDLLGQLLEALQNKND